MDIWLFLSTATVQSAEQRQWDGGLPGLQAGRCWCAALEPTQGVSPTVRGEYSSKHIEEKTIIWFADCLSLHWENNECWQTFMTGNISCSFAMNVLSGLVFAVIANNGRVKSNRVFPIPLNCNLILETQQWESEIWWTMNRHGSNFKQFFTNFLAFNFNDCALTLAQSSVSQSAPHCFCLVFPSSL